MKCGSDVSGEQGSVATAMMPAAQEKDASEELLALLRAATLGEYVIHRELGRGGMATVYLAHEIALDRKVAIKVMSPALHLMGEGMAERFKREARTAANLSHPHIIPIYTVKSAGKTLFFVMKFIAGRSLEAIIKDLGPMPIPMVKAMLQQVGSALGYAHRHGIVHRDVKPANIMIDEEGWSVVTDFGIAKVAENRGLTMTGIAVGTPSYMSPEQCAAKDITGKSDQYSLGIVAYEMITGKQPFEGDSAMAMMFAHFHEKPKPLTEVRPDCPLELAAAVMRMLEKGPDQRWPSLDDALVGMAAQPLAHEDPVRLQLLEIVRRDSNRKLLDAVTPPPSSPVPRGKTRPMVDDATTPLPRTRASAAEAMTTPIPAPRITAVSIVPAKSDLHSGDSLQLTATPRGQGGTAVGHSVKWASSDVALATVSPTGLVTARGAGSVTITATAEGATGTAQLTITPVPVASVAVVPANGSVAAGGSLQFSATPRDEHGGVLRDRTVRWSTSNTGLAAIDDTGLVTATEPGRVEVVAEIEVVRGSVALTILPAPVAAIAIAPAEPAVVVGDSIALAATLTDGKGRTLAGRALTWRSAADKVVTVASSGVVTGLSDGTAQITAEAEGKSATVTVRVTRAPVAAVTLTQPDPLVAGERVQLQAALTDGRGRPLTGRELKWSSSSPAIATVTASGLLTGMGAGSAKVTVESEGKGASISLTIKPVPAASVVIDGMPAALAAGASATLHAVVKDAKGHVLTGRDVAWTTSAGEILAVSAAGVISAKGAGQAIITATVEGQKAQASLTISVPPPVAPEVPTEVMPKAVVPVATVVVPPPVATRRDAEVAPPPPSAAAPPVVASPRAAPRSTAAPTSTAVPAPAAGGKGKLIGAVVGLAVIAAVAFAMMNRGSPDVVIPAAPIAPAPPAPVAQVAINGAAEALAVGRTEQLSVVLRDAAGQELNSRSVTWTSSDPSVAVVSAVGAVTGRKAGSVTITASSEGQSATAPLSVEAAGSDLPAQVATVSLTGGGKAVEVGETITLVARAADAKGTTLSDRAIVWSTSDPQVALVSSVGLVSAVGPGTSTISASSEGKSAESRITVNAPRPAPTAPAPVPVAAPVAVAKVLITPGSASVVAGEEVQLFGGTRDAKGNELADRDLAWSSADARVAAVSKYGLVTGLAEGATTITASAEGKSASVKLTVTPAKKPVIAVGSVALTSAVRTLKVGETTSWTATARDAKATALADRTISWSSSQERVATVTQSGVIAAVAAGTAEIRAESEGKFATATITVQAPPPPSPPAQQLPPPVVTVIPTTPPKEKETPTTPPATGAAGNALLPRRGVEAGSVISCGVAQGGAVCWGAGSPALLLIEGTAGMTSVDVGQLHACGLLGGGQAVCWGGNKLGQLGNGSSAASSSAAAVDGGLSFSAITVGDSHSCGLTGGKAWCWGKNTSGQLGDGSTSDRKRPVAVKGGLSFTALSAGDNHTCGVTAAAKAYCWGDGFSGQLGMGSQEQQPEPIDVSGELKFSRIAAGGQHTCALTTSGKAYCWGGNQRGQLGDGSKSDRATPVPVGSPQSFVEISAGGGHSCAITSGGEAFCWGGNKAGQLGDGSKVDRNKPVSVVGGGFTTISAGDGHSCGMTHGAAQCWGRNDKGQLGDGVTTARGTPGPVGE
ncbi:MAG: Ig-like domain-containing protein [Gemmatimonadota bacterium]|nr:Ig-like domain-containing protein [Gemmatimonadota bacterium]